MGSIQIRVAEKFPEPAFAQLQRTVFKDLQEHSPSLAAALREEAELFPEATPAPAASYSPSLRLGAYVDDELVGWSFGWLERGRIFYMANSGVVEAHRGRGIYSQLVRSVLEHARAMGAVVVRSNHSVLNNAIIIAKLRLGFQVSGLSQSAQMGALVELSHHLSPARHAVFRSRFIPLTGTEA